MLSAEQIGQFIGQSAKNAGFELAGVAPVREDDLPELSAFVEWVDAGYAGEMKYLEKRTKAGELRRASARNAAPWVRSVVVCGLNYNTDRPFSTEVDDPLRGSVSRCAWGNKDYHQALQPRLKEIDVAIQQLASQHSLTAETRSYVDTGPIVERVYAKYAGLGCIARKPVLTIPTWVRSFFWDN